MTRYLFDTNHASQYLKATNPIAGRVALHVDDRFGLCEPVVGELWFMVYNSQRLSQNVEDLTRLLGEFENWAFDAKAAEVFGRLKAELRRTGRNVADVDLQIASVAIAHELVLLTGDGAFGNVPGLRYENWLE